MDDKWVGFFRSWTGHQIYRLAVRKSGTAYEVGPLEVIDDSNVYRRTSDAFDIDMAKRLLNRLTTHEAQTG